MNLSSATSRSPDSLSNFRGTSSLFTFHYGGDTETKAPSRPPLSSQTLSLNPFGKESLSTALSLHQAAFPVPKVVNVIVAITDFVMSSRF